MSELHKDRLENRITEQEFSQRLDEANEQEAKNQEHLGPSFIRQALENVEKDISEDQKKAFILKIEQEKFAQDQLRQKEQNEQRERARKIWNEQKAKERKEQEEQKAREIEQKRKEQERLSFREVTGNTIHEREASAQNLQRQYNTWQIILLIFSALTATMAGIDGISRGLVAFTGVIATIAGSMLTTFKLQDRIYANHKAVAELRLECQKYDYHIDEYKDRDVQEAFIKFSRAINIIQGEQMLQEVELWNPRREEGRKAQIETKEKELEKTQNAEVSEKQVSDDPSEEQDESVEKQKEGASSLSRQDPVE